MFWFPSEFKSYVSTKSIKYAIAECLKRAMKIPYLKNTWLLKVLTITSAFCKYGTNIWLNVGLPQISTCEKSQ